MNYHVQLQKAVLYGAFANAPYYLSMLTYCINTKRTDCPSILFVSFKLFML